MCQRGWSSKLSKSIGTLWKVSAGASSRSTRRGQGQGDHALATNVFVLCMQRALARGARSMSRQHQMQGPTCKMPSMLLSGGVLKVRSLPASGSTYSQLICMRLQIETHWRHCGLRRWRGEMLSQMMLQTRLESRSLKRKQRPWQEELRRQSPDPSLKPKPKQWRDQSDLMKARAVRLSSKPLHPVARPQVQTQPLQTRLLHSAQLEVGCNSPMEFSQELCLS